MLEPLLKSLPSWALFALVFIFGGGGIGLIAYVARPAKDTIADLRADVEASEKKIEDQQKQINTVLTTVAFQGQSIVALAMHSDQLRNYILRFEPSANVETAEQVLSRVHATINANPPPAT